jgi:hypothetical protein
LQLAYRATRRQQPHKSDTLVSSREQAFALIASLDKKLAGKLSSQERATYLCGRAVLYEALGDREMLSAAQEAYKYSKTAQSAALVAVALHHYGRIKESIEWYGRAYSYPHEPGYEIDIGQQGALLFQQTDQTWLKAWEITKQLKKRIVWAAHLPTWNGQPVKELQVLSEGGNGDLIQNCRFLPLLKERGVERYTIFLPPFFFESGFVDLIKRQPWCPEIKRLVECKPGIPSAGFFDLAAIAGTLPSTIPPAPTWNIDPERDSSFAYALCHMDSRPKIGITWAARAMETPICAPSVYRELGQEQAQRLVSGIDANWISLQVPDLPLEGVTRLSLKSWDDTAAVINNLDAVVTVDTAVMHLAASLGKQTHVLLSGAVDWKFSTEGQCPWYPDMILWRNEDWGFENAINNFIAHARKWPPFQISSEELVL